MPEPHPFDLASAERAAAVGEIEGWVQAYLASGPWANRGLAEGLLLQQRWWRGPVGLPLGRLQRCCGPEAEMEYRVEPAAWERRVNAIAASLTTPAALPPLIAEYRAGLLSVRDGNHRLAAIERAGWPATWVIIWYNAEAEYRAGAAEVGGGYAFEGRI